MKTIFASCLASCLASCSFLVLCSTIGCGGSSSNPTGAPPTTGLPPSKSLGALTPDEANKLCAANQQFATQQLGPVLCQFAGAAAGLGAKTDAEAQSMCKMSLSECTAALGMSTGATGTCKAPPASCTATVGEFEMCMAEATAAFEQLAMSLPSCDKLTTSTKPTPPTGGGAFTNPAACAALQAKCPGIDAGPGSIGGV